MQSPVTPPADEIWTSERCFIREIINHPDEGTCSLARARVPVDTTTRLHRVSVREWYVILSGRGIVTVGEQTGIAVSPGDVVEIPPGTAQRIQNTEQDDLIFECLCIPRFTPDCYESLEGE